MPLAYLKLGSQKYYRRGFVGEHWSSCSLLAARISKKDPTLLSLIPLRGLTGVAKECGGALRTVISIARALKMEISPNP